MEGGIPPYHQAGIMIVGVYRMIPAVHQPASGSRAKDSDDESQEEWCTALVGSVTGHLRWP